MRRKSNNKTAVYKRALGKPDVLERVLQENPKNSDKQKVSGKRRLENKEGNKWA